VAVEEKDPDSLLNFYKQLIRLRRTQPPLRDGKQTTVNCHDADVLSYLRKNPNDGESLLIVLNMSNQPKSVVFDLRPQSISGSTARPLLVYPPTSATNVPLGTISLPPFGTLVAAVK
jgi:alpha-glucosidase